MANVTIVVGAQWGDEGKGKWIDILVKDADIVARYQGGNNAGHTLYVDGQKVVLRQLPSGVFNPNTLCAVAAGVVVNPVQLVDEINEIRSIVALTPERVVLSVRSQVITPWHVHLDELKEREAPEPIGTTKRGIGPTYADKAARVGLRLGHYVDPVLRRRWIEQMTQVNPQFKEFYLQNADAWQRFDAAATTLRPFVTDAETLLRRRVAEGQRLLLEGAQGTLLDIDHGTYPYVTSSSTAAGGACASLGLSPKAVDAIYGVAKAYVTRVGAGSFPTELHDAAGQAMATVGKEFGAVTGRPRRCGWFDAVAMRYSTSLNGFDGLILNKMDVLTGLAELKICVAYRHPSLGLITDFPWDERILAACEPVYETYEGWSEAMPRQGRIGDLPPAARRYVAAVEQHASVKVMAVGTGVERNDALYA